MYNLLKKMDNFGKITANGTQKYRIYIKDLIITGKSKKNTSFLSCQCKTMLS